MYHDFIEQNNAYEYINPTKRDWEAEYTVMSGTMAFRFDALQDFKACFENLLRWTLEQGHFHSEEAVYSLMLYRFPFLISVYGKLPIDNMKNFDITPPFYTLDEGTSRHYQFDPS